MDRPHNLESIATVAGKAQQLLLCSESISDDASRLKCAIELDRFNLWAHNIGVFAPQHASLDYRLRTAASVKTTIEGNLEILIDDILLALSGGRDCTEAEIDELENAPVASAQTLGLRLAQNSKGGSSEQMLLAIQSAGETISTLHRLSLSIRRASNRNALLKAITLPEVDEAFTWRYKGSLEDGILTKVEAVRFDSSVAFENYVARLLNCRWLASVAKGYQLCPCMITYRATMLKRCVAAISARRRQLAYFQNHQTKMQESGSGQKRGGPPPAWPPAPAEENRTTQQPPEFAVDEVGVDAQSSTIASSFHYSRYQHPSPSIGDATSTTSSDGGVLRDTGAFEIPPAPEYKRGDREKMCPYCCLVLPVTMFDGRRKARKWRRHLCDDLQPYVCLHASCSSSGRTYRSVPQWMAHMEQSHHLASTPCPDCFHQTQPPPAQSNSENCDPSNDGDEKLEILHLPQRCFVCLKWFPSSISLWNDLAVHLQSAFLAALPWRDDVRDEDDVSSVGMSRQSSDSPYQPLFQRLRSSMQYSSIVEQNFVPQNALSDLVTEETIMNELPANLISGLWPDDLPSQVAKNAKRIFAILVMIGEPEAIRKLVDDGHTDDDLPFARPLHDDHSSIVESRRKQEVKSFQDWENDAKVDMFLEKQWLFLAAILDVSGKSTVLLVDSKCPLPLLRATELRDGHRNIVYKSELPAAHQKGVGAQNTDMTIAVKMFRKADGFKMFEREKENLLETRGINDRHLIRYLFFCERDKSYFIGFPWAEGGNLQEFWILHTSNPRLMLWSLQQMLGISGALRKLHDINCRHGNLQLRNILHFPEGGLGNLVIAGFGLAEVHTAATNMSRHTAPSYEPPETRIRTETPRSRRYDIWSIGCVYLEFIIWMMYGFNAINSFAESRDEAEFYVWQEDKLVLHPSVVNAFAVLRNDPRCKGDTAVGALIDLITQHLLLIQVGDRATADVLYEKLEKIVRRATNDPSFIANQTKPPHETPAIFDRPVEIPEGLRSAMSW